MKEIPILFLISLFLYLFAPDNGAICESARQNNVGKTLFLVEKLKTVVPMNWKIIEHLKWGVQEINCTILPIISGVHLCKHLCGPYA